MNEIWKPIEGFEGLYKISDQGRIYSVKSRKCLKPGSTGRYLFVVLCKDGKRHDLLVHRLVAKAFCTKQEGETEVNHINENRFDNRAENLEWCTHLENIRHGTGIAKRAFRQMNGKRNKQIIQLSEDGTHIKKYRSIRDASRITGYDRSFITRCANGKVRMAYGYKWQYASEYNKTRECL